MRPEVPHSLPDGTWEQMDDVDLHEVFLLRIPILKSCPYFLRGRLRECFATILRERNRAELAGDIVAKERAWKAFGLVPLLLLHRPRGWVETDFGQSDFGHPYPTDFGQTDFGQTNFGQTDFGQR